MKGSRRGTGRSWRHLVRNNNGTTALEFGLIAIPFLIFIFGAFEVAFDLYTKAVLDASLMQAARQIQVGNTQNTLNGNDFLNKFVCPGIGYLLACQNIYVKIQRISLGTSQDYYDYTTGQAPVAGGVLNLSGYGSANFCNSAPSQLLLVSAVYVGPAILGSLVPGAFAVSYNGGFVHPSFSSIGTVTEAYSPAAVIAGAASAC